MSVRLLLTDEKWSQLELILNEVKRKDGRPADQSDRMFIEAVLYVARTGIPWRDLPPIFGNWSAVYNRLVRWKNNGTWEKLWKSLSSNESEFTQNLFIDTTIVRAHQHAAGAPHNKGGQEHQALGKSRGGFSTKIHLGCLNEKKAIAIILTPGQTPDCKGFDRVLEGLHLSHSLKNGIMDKSYDTDEIRETLAEAEMAAVIPPKKNRTTQIDYDEVLYKERNKIERFINKIKQFRRIATRYEKLSETFLAFLHIVSAYVTLN